MNTIQHNLLKIKNQIIQITTKYNNLNKNIKLIAVSKTKSCDAIQQAINAGQNQFGENYLQEAIKKIIFFDKKNDLIWHFLGSIQSNKIKLIAQYFDWCHTIDRFSIAEELNKKCLQHNKLLNILIQVNIDNEKHKSGILPEHLDTLVNEVILLPNLKLRGLMVIPKKCNCISQQIKTFNKMNILFCKLKNNYSYIDTLSMGMSNDFHIAIAYGSTLIRIGTAIFGNR